EHAPVLVLGRQLEWGGAADAGIVDEHVHGPVPRHRLEGAAHRGRRRDVELDHLDRQARLGRRGTQGLRLAEIPHASEDAVAMTRQMHTGRESDAGAGAGDYGGLHPSVSRGSDRWARHSNRLWRGRQGGDDSSGGRDTRRERWGTCGRTAPPLRPTLALDPEPARRSRRRRKSATTTGPWSRIS